MTVRLPVFLAALASVGALAAQGPAPRVDFALKSSTVLLGEPVVVSVTVRNDSDTETSLLFPIGHFEVDWIARAGSGAEVAQWHPTGDVASELTRLIPGAVRKFTIVASGTAAIRVPGEYEITPHYHPLDISKSLPFTVVSSSGATLGQRAREFHDAALLDGEDGATAAEALASMSYAVPVPQLCEVMERNRLAPNFIAPRLEAIDSPEAVHCLTRVMSSQPAQGIYIQWALQRLAKSEKDPALRGEIEQTLARFCIEPIAGGTSCSQAGR